MIIEGHILDTEMTRQKFKHILDSSGAKRIFEIGFNAGNSARLWLDLGVEHIQSIDICKWDYTEGRAHELMQEDARFKFRKMDSANLEESDLDGYDLLFVDGDHATEAVRNDILLGASAKIPYILVDDYNSSGWNGRIRECVDNVIRQIEYVWADQTLHYDSTGGINRMRLMKYETTGI